ncbi:MAG: hypothetical protein BMS9Abin23_0894 [Thermodesulfobacteriota bacterium]|nr:MAG: hypothetical protein BMS9Abin23_0894 [Thermodesulfobacteriota bacterium]
MFGHSKTVDFDKNMHVFNEEDEEVRHLEKEEIAFIGAFTGIVVLALLFAFVL